ncbi:unnamed protein product [Symbiodinium pilosum]|uniref:Uncharacterized protein n=1 Tax=Symbiodinium pilosum TaxID=2952 RepID=A0A812X170_SYMPI|nr:unnamed protein product [Symbiodinium pilosum]
MLRTDTVEELELALVDWVNACHPDAEAEEFDDLADGSILAEVLQLFAPEVDPTNSAAGSAKLLHGCLSAYFGSRIALPRLAGNMHNGAFCKPALLRALCEAVMLAAVEGPRKEEAIQAIMNLDEMSCRTALLNFHLWMIQENATATQQVLYDAAMSVQISKIPASAHGGGWQRLLQDMRDRLNTEEMAISGLQSSQKALVYLIHHKTAFISCRVLTWQLQSLEAQLRGVMVDYAAEEEQAAETDSLLQKWQRSHGEDLRHFKAECDALRSDLDRETEDMPQRQSKLQKQLKMEVDALQDLQDKNGNLEVEIRQAGNVHDMAEHEDMQLLCNPFQLAWVWVWDWDCDSGSLPRPPLCSRWWLAPLHKEKEEIRLARAKSLWEAFHVAEVTAQAREDSFRQLRRVAEKEEESELDVVGLLEFRESEMRQLEQDVQSEDSGPAPSQQRTSVVESNVSFTKRSSMRASISGPPGAGAAELLRGLPDLQERRILLKELAKTSRAQSTWQGELQQQQQRTRELEHRLQQLSDEAAQLHSSEARALTELGVRKQEEQRCAAELRERDHLVQAEVRRANLEKDQMNGVRRAGQQTAELQRELLVARSELQTQREANDEKSQHLSDLKEEMAETEAESANLREQREEQMKAVAQRAQTSEEKSQSRVVAEELQQAEQSLQEVKQRQRELSSREDAESARLQRLQQSLAEEQRRLKEHELRSEAQRHQLQNQKAALQAQREALEALKLLAQEAKSQAPPRPSLNLQATVAPGQAMTPEQAGTAAAAAARVAGKALEEQSSAAANAAAAAAEAQGASIEQQTATAAAAAGAAAAAAARSAKEPRADQVAAAAAAAAKAAEAAGATKAQHTAVTAAAAGAAAAAAERATGKNCDEQAAAAAEAAIAAATECGGGKEERQNAAAGAAGSAALLAAKMVGMSKKEQLGAAAEAAAVAAAREGALPGLCSEVAQAAALRGAAKLGVPEDQARDIARNCVASKSTPKQDVVPEQSSSTKSGKAALKKLRLQLAAQEGKMRQTEAASAERKEAMRRETQLLADSLREVGLRCHMLIGKHKMLLDDRKRLEAEA